METKPLKVVGPILKIRKENPTIYRNKTSKKDLPVKD